MTGKNFCFTLGFLIWITFQTTAQEPFTCNGEVYITTGNGGGDCQLYEVLIDNSQEGVRLNALENLVGVNINGIGYRRTDNFIYGVNPTTFHLYQVDATGRASILTTLPLNPDFSYFAGDVSPNGDFLTLLANDLLIKVDLASGNYNLTNVNLSMGLSCRDIVFDPFTGILYGFDSNEDRLVTIDINTGFITTFPRINVVGNIPALFFDSFGNLFGFGNNSSDEPLRFYKINKETGQATLFDPTVTLIEGCGSDGCSCPFTAKLQKTVSPRIAKPCSEIVYTFKIANLGIAQNDITLHDIMPEGLTLIDLIYNPFGGVLNGTGTNEFSITNMSIPIGVDSILVKVEVGGNTRGIYRNQASLSNLSLETDQTILSDDPNTLVKNDSTQLIVAPLDAGFDQDTLELCTGSEIVLEPATEDGLNFNWNTGSNESSLRVASPGTYSVTISNDCEMIVVSVEVINRDVTINLGEDKEIELGESIELIPLVSSSNTTTFYSWTENQDNILECKNCETIVVQPLFDALYTVSIQTQSGCQASDDINIYVRKNRDLFFPNAFSPNSDGINDIFYFQSKVPIQIKIFRIFDRWGNLLFEKNNIFTNDLTNGWNGKFKNEHIGTGVYVWYAELEFLDGVNIPYKGDVILIR